MDRLKLACLWWDLMQIPAREFFTDQPDRMVIGSSPHGTIMSPGYVGRHYEPGGWLLVGNYPAGGTATSIERPNPTDERLYRSFLDLAAAETDEDRLACFETMSATWIELQCMYPIYKTLFMPVLHAGKKSDDDIAFINAFPFRCRDNIGPSVGMYSAAWRLAVSQQIQALQPGKIIALGVATGKAIQRFYNDADLVILERSNGDRYLKDSTQRAIRNMLQEHVASENTGHRELVDEEHQYGHSTAPVERAADRDTGGEGNPKVAQFDVSSREMSVDEYPCLFNQLGLQATRGHTLKRTGRKPPSLYFNYKADGRVFFTGYKQDTRFYSSEFWDQLPPQQAKDENPRLMTVRPKVGQATAAFEDWLYRFDHEG